MGSVEIGNRSLVRKPPIWRVKKMYRQTTEQMSASISLSNWSANNNRRRLQRQNKLREKSIIRT